MTFFRELKSRFGAAGDFAQAYVIAHEFGHHVQHSLGIDEQVKSREDGIKLELQADCLAGVWGHSAAQRKLLEPGDLEEGLGAAASVGDDRIQQKTRAASTPSRGRTAPPPSGRSGSRSASTAATRPPATPSRRSRSSLDSAHGRAPPRAQGRHGPLRRPGRLHRPLRAARSGGRRRRPSALPRAAARESSSNGAERSRSSSATRWSRSSARRSRGRTIRSARFARRSRSATGRSRRTASRCGSR